MKTKIKKINNTHKFKIRNNNNILNIDFNFKFFEFRSVRIKNLFTNYVKNKDDAVKEINKLFKELPLNASLSDIIGNHNHSLNDKADMIYKILGELGISELNETSNEYNDFYQLGLTNGSRLICYRASNIFYPLFIDVHHLIYGSEKYNNKDFYNYKIDIFMKK